VKRRKPFKPSRLPEPKEGDIARMREPTISELLQLRAQLDEHTVKPLPPRLHSKLRALIYWAGWSLNRAWTPDRIRYQRYCHVLEGHRLAVRKGLKTGLWRFAYRYAEEKLAGSPAECGIEMMRKSYEAERDATYE
jgi:hypothetical protein